MAIICALILMWIYGNSPARSITEPSHTFFAVLAVLGTVQLFLLAWWWVRSRMLLFLQLSFTCTALAAFAACHGNFDADHLLPLIIPVLLAAGEWSRLHGLSTPAHPLAAFCSCGGAASTPLMHLLLPHRPALQLGSAHAVVAVL